jgi:hypothetical protein
MAINGVGNGNTGVVYNNTATPPKTGDAIVDMINELAAGTGAPLATVSMFEEPKQQPVDMSGGGVSDLNQLMANVQAIADAAGGKGAIGTSAEFLLQGLQLMTEKVDSSDPDALAQQAKDMQTFMQYCLNPAVSQKMQQILQVAEMSPDQLSQMNAKNAQREADADAVLRNLGVDPTNLKADLGTAGANSNLGDEGMEF